MNGHGILGTGIGQIEANPEMLKLKEMGRTYILNNDGKMPTADIKEKNKAFVERFLKIYSDVLEKVNPSLAKGYRKLSTAAIKHDFGETVIGKTGVFASKMMQNGVILRDQKLPNINK